MAGTLKITDIRGDAVGTLPLFKDSAGTEYGQLCRAWVRFDGTGTPAIAGSFNVSSITDNGVGDYTVNFINAMPNTDYVPVACVDPALASKVNNANFPNFYSFGTSALGYATANSAAAAADYAINCIAVFGD